MSTPLEKLLLLQDREMALNKASQDLVRIPKEEAQIDEKLQQNLKQFEELKLKAKKVEASRKEIELNVEDRKNRIAKYQVQQYETKKNEEYQALGHEIERLRGEITQLEDMELELMEQYEAAQKGVAAESAKVKEYTQAAETLKANLKKKQETLAERQAGLKAAVEEAVEGVDATLLGRYRRILSSKKDAAIVPIKAGNICGGCHMQVTPQTALQAKANTDLVTCEQCGRILYWAKG